MSVVTSVIDQNNETLAYLEDGNYSHAIASSLSALARLSVSNNLQGQNQPQNSSSATSGSLDRCMLLSAPCGDDDEESESSNQAYFIYEHGIMLPSTTTDPTISTPILIFNAALAHHLLAEERGTSTEDLQRAKRLYELAFGSQGAQHQNTLFRFAVINNIAVIDRQLGNMEQSEQNSRRLLSVLMLYVVDKRYAVQLRHLRGFFMNVFANSQIAKAA